MQKIWVPLNALDFAPYLTQLNREVDAICAVFVAAQGVRFIKQYAEYGLKARLPLIGSGVMTDEHVIRNLGDEAIGAVGDIERDEEDHGAGLDRGERRVGQTHQHDAGLPQRRRDEVPVA